MLKKKKERKRERETDRDTERKRERQRQTENEYISAFVVLSQYFISHLQEEQKTLQLYNV